MFNKESNNNNGNGNKVATQQQQPTAINLISAGTRIEGQVQSQGDIRIDGNVKGTVISKAKIVIGPSGVVDGDIVCENADVSGKVFGKVQVQEILFLKSTAYLEGDISTGKLVVESGAMFSGSCHMGVKEMKPSEKIITQPAQKEAV